MKEIKVENPTVKSCAPYGTFTRLTDYEAFRGDGWRMLDDRRTVYGSAWKIKPVPV